MTLLEAISLTSRQLLLQCRHGITKSDKHTIHAPYHGRPLCGGGFKAADVQQWQTDIGGVTCKACLKIINHQKYD